MKEAFYLGFLIIQVHQSKTVIYEFWYNYVKPKYEKQDCVIRIKTNSLFTQKHMIFIKIF